jgi:predicted amidohydrolase YtcJ
MFHVTGDAGIDTVLDAFDASANPESPWPAIRPRFEHADMTEPSHFDRLKRHGVVIVQNPSHFMIPEIMNARLGERVRRAQLMKSMLKAGIPVALGSDGPLNPFLNIMFAVMHPTNPAEGLSIDQALAAYTRGSAFAEGAERQKGTLAAGMLADLAILSQDIFTVPAGDLPKTTSVLTVVGGRVVHDALVK